jgi:trans-aconitate methyltransferase
MSPWATFYEGREGASYQSYVQKRYRPYIEAIEKRVRPRDLVLELGAGTGTITKALAVKAHLYYGARLAATDVDPEMVDIVKRRLQPDDISVYRENAFLGGTRRTWCTATACWSTSATTTSVR